MGEAAKPPNEAERLARLRELNILDTTPEERFDRYTRLVCRLLDVPIALVSLVDENRQWFKSRQGLDAPETDRRASFCAHAILKDEVMVVENAEDDPRFADNPLVTGDPNIRFYAGCPLKTPAGHNVGTLCIIDRQPRQLSEEDLEVLSDFANLVAGELVSEGVATTDTLTGMSNLQGLQIMVEKIQKSGNLPKSACVVLVDIAGFRSITREFGDEEGKQTVITFSEMILEVFGEIGVIAREADDRFCIYLPDAVSERPGYFLQQLRTLVNERNEMPEQKAGLNFYAEAVRCRGDQALDTTLDEAKRLIEEQKAARN